MAQFNYDAHWKKVEEFNKKGLPKSALTEVNAIYAQALKQKEDVQLVKSLMARTEYMEDTEENESEKILQELNTHITQFNGPVKALFLSMKGQLLLNYLQQNRYKLYRRTAVENDTTTDVTAWTIDRLNKEIAIAFEASLEQKTVLQQASLAKYDPILIKGQNTRELRPSLYDLLAHRALDYFKSGETSVSRPADQFELQDTAAFAPVNVFAAHHFVTTDTASLQYHALLLLQDLLRFHEKDNKAILLDLDLERIAYMNQVGVMPDKDALYLKLLKEMEQTYSEVKESTQITYLLAQSYYQKGNSQTDKASGEMILLAKTLCEKAIKQAPESLGGINCAFLLEQIKNKSLKLETELANLPAIPFRTLVTYKNVGKIYLRVASINEAFRQSLRVAEGDYQDGERYWRLLQDRKVLKSWEQPLTGTEDYREHSTEIKIDALPLGQYMILASTTPDFSLKENILSVQFVHVTEISYINREDGNSSKEANLYYVLHRQTGKPLADVNLNIWNSRNSGDAEPVKSYSAVSAKDGSLSLKTLKNGSSIRMQWIKGADEFFPDDYKYIYNYNYNDNEDTSKYKTFLFTDRAIYRPGQTLYFKGIVIKKGKPAGKSSVQANHKATIILHDANGDEVDSVQVTSNEYGSYSGKFRLPEGRLNGVYQLEENKTNSQVAFSVEEYKRPKFYVEFDKLKGSYRLGDSVTVNGKALAFAGNNIDNAKVKFRVKRVARFPYPWLMWGRSYYNVAAREITQGELTTSADGTFNIVFPALPDLSIDKTLKPIFTYTVEADVTDLNGETHSGNQSVSAGYQSLEIVLTTEPGLQITTQNLDGNLEPANVNISVKPLEHPGRLLRTRYWRKPDQFVIAKDVYIKDFPVDIYKDEDDNNTWVRAAAVYTKQATTTKDSSLSLKDVKLKAGWYELEVSTVDKYGETILQKKTFEITDPVAKTLAYPVYFRSTKDKDQIEPGETIKMQLGSAAKDVYVLQSMQKVDQKEVFSSFVIDAKVEEKTYTASEEDRGNVAFQYIFVKDNRVFTDAETVIIPWSNKDLEVTVATHRDKLLPGEKEKWQVNIKGYKGSKVAAEMLATMYDASLDAFRKHSWSAPNLYPTLYSYNQWSGSLNFREIVSVNHEHHTAPDVPRQKPFSYDELAWSIGNGDNFRYKESSKLRGGMSVQRSAMPMAMAAPAPAAMMDEGRISKKEKSEDEMSNVVAADKPKPAGANTAETEKVQPRTNFNESAFFFPDLRTDKDGNISFEFTVPEALTRWNFLSLTHTKDAAFGTAVSSVITQKPLMVQPNAPRFIREGDKMEFSAKISNLADSALTGEAHLELLDATTMKPVDGWFQNIFPVQHFTVQKGQSTAVSFPVQIPFNFGSSLLYRVIAQAGKFSDGEENALPVLTNTMLVTETLPLAMRGDGTRSFTMPKLIHSDTSETIQQHAFTVEFSANPTWYAVQALPYLMEYPYECSEQVFNRYYANTLASYIANKIPGIKDVFEKWKITDTAALQSNLQKNEELKAVLLQETPWVLEAKNEAEQKQRIALLFDLQRMSGEQKKAITQLQEKQLPSGAFPWFTGMWEDQYITQYILAGIGRLQQVGALDKNLEAATSDIVNKALIYVDKQIDDNYHRLKAIKGIDMNQQHIGYLEAHYLYLRSLFPAKPVSAQHLESYKYYLSQAKKYWLQQGKYTQAMLAIALQRKDDATTAKAIVSSLKEHAVVNDEMGMYWKDVRAGYWWYEAPIETQAILIEAFEVVTHDTVAVSDMKTWLLKNKQTNNWHTTKATADACYAMLLGSSNWLGATPQVDIHLGSTVVSSATEKTEAGTGYLKKRFEAQQVKPEMGKIDVTVQGSHGQPSWGAVYWQYFEQLDKITGAATPLTLQKRLFIQKNTGSGPVLTAIQEGNELKVGDKVKVQVTMKVDRDMEYVHLKDMRAACFEPENVISTCKWQNGVSYYESTKDASTNFFFSRLPKGTYVFEYTLFVTHQGNFSNGISTAQCMYAPEFSAHSEGVRVKVIE
jgi:uncharacterized protein YfaS (alpha-2-macroglobulin family)